MPVWYAVERKPKPYGISRSCIAVPTFTKNQTTSATTTIPDTIWDVHCRTWTCRQSGMPWYVRFRGIDDMRLSEAPDRGAARFRGIAGRCALPNPVHQTRGAGRKPLAMRKCASGQPRRGLSTSEARRISVRPWGSRRMGRRPTGRCAHFRAAGRFRLVRGGGRISRRSCPRNGSRPAPPYS